MGRPRGSLERGGFCMGRGEPVCRSGTDEYHENGGGGWDGDSVQIGFANAAQDTITHLYNYGLSDEGEVVIHNEKGPGGTEAVIERDDESGTTIYELMFPASSIGLEGYKGGMQFGVGVCVNDGDEGQEGQKGWSGWGPYTIAYGLSLIHI